VCEVLISVEESGVSEGVCSKSRSKRDERVDRDVGEVTFSGELAYNALLP